MCRNSQLSRIVFIAGKVCALRWRTGMDTRNAITIEAHCEHEIVSLPVNDAIDAVMQFDAASDASTSSTW
jgi:hypothetical protein